MNVVNHGSVGLAWPDIRKCCDEDAAIDRLWSFGLAGTSFPPVLSKYLLKRR